MKFEITFSAATTGHLRDFTVIHAKGFNLSDGFAHFFNEHNQLTHLYNLAQLISIVPDQSDLAVAWKEKQEQQTTKQRT